MTNNITRKGNGADTGNAGHFAATQRKASTISLASDRQRAAEIAVDDAARSAARMARGRDKLREGTVENNRIHIVAAAAITRQNFPAAKTLVFRENQDGEDQLEPAGILDEDGNQLMTDEDLPHVQDSLWEATCEVEPTLAHDNGWTYAVGGKVIAGDRRMGDTELHIDLDQALAYKPAPHTPAYDDILTREEQSALATAASTGLDELKDRLDQPGQEPGEIERLEREVALLERLFERG